MNLQQSIAAYLADNRLTALYRDAIGGISLDQWRILGLKDVYFTGGGGCYLFDQHGERYVDFISGFGAHLLGRNHPAIADTIRQVSECETATLVRYAVPILATMFAEKLLEFTDRDFHKVVITNSGTEAVEAALKLAMCVTGKREFVYLENAFHGLTLGALGVIGIDSLPPGLLVNAGNHRVTPNDHEQLEKTIAGHHQRLAGVIVEPVLGKNGIVLSNEYVNLIRALCDKYGLTLIFDEIQTGFFRTGRKFAYLWHDVRPDVMVVSKGLSGGVVPIGAALYSDAIYKKAFNRKRNADLFSSTFKENNLAMAVGLTVLEELDRGDFGELVMRREKVLRDYFLGHSGVRVAGKGLLLSLHHESPVSVLHKVAGKFERNHFMKLMMVRLIREHRIITYADDHVDNCMKLLPSLAVTEDIIEYFCERFCECLEYFSNQSNTEFAFELTRIFSSSD